MRILGIDYGDARVGISITDPLGITAQGLETIHHEGNDKVVLKRLEDLIKEYNVPELSSSVFSKKTFSISTANVFPNLLGLVNNVTAA